MPLTPNAESERIKYQKIWTVPDYRKVSPGEQGVEFAIWKMEWDPGDRVIDLGCGTGRAAHAMHEYGIVATACDTAINCLDQKGFGFPFFQHCLTDPLPSDLRNQDGFCTDVMEHIPPDLIHNVLHNIAEGCERVFFGIAHFPSEWAGEVLHLTVEPPQWWADKLEMHFDTVERLGGFNIRADHQNSYWKCVSHAETNRQSAE